MSINQRLFMFTCFAYAVAIAYHPTVPTLTFLSLLACLQVIMELLHRRGR